LPVSPGRPASFRLEKDSCGVGFIANIKGKQVASDRLRRAHILCQSRASRRGRRRSARTLLGWRDVPTDNSSLGETVKPTEPVHMQVFIGRGAHIKTRTSSSAGSISCASRFRRRSTSAARPRPRRLLPGVSMSCRTIVYKGMVLADQLGPTIPTCTTLDFESALALVHQRFSTNTFPSWRWRIPIAWSRTTARSTRCAATSTGWRRGRPRHSELFGADISKLWPISYEGQSDTACFDNALEFLVQGGYSLRTR
jgi:glutamate synthase (NADPH/NADH) large chain